jgi:hypothetical protein
MIVRSRDRDKVRAAAEAVLRVINDAVEESPVNCGTSYPAPTPLIRPVLLTAG